MARSSRMPQPAPAQASCPRRSSTSTAVAFRMRSVCPSRVTLPTCSKRLASDSLARSGRCARSRRARGEPAVTGTLHRHTLQRDPAVAAGIKHEHGPDSAPVERAYIVAVDESPERIEQLERALTRRFGDDYDLVTESSPHRARE